MGGINEPPRSMPVLTATPCARVGCAGAIFIDSYRRVRCTFCGRAPEPGSEEVA